MRLRTTVAPLCILLSAGACAGATTPKPDLAAEQQAIHQFTDSLVAAEIRRDADAVVANYAPDAVVHLPGLPAIVGREALRAAFKEFLAATPFTDEKMVGRTLIVAASGDLAYDLGSDNFFNKTAAGTTEEKGKSIIIYRKIEGKWTIVANSYSTDASPVAAPAPSTK